MRSLSDKAKETQSALVDEWNTVHSSTLKVTYIDSTPIAFSGHEPDPSAARRNDYRWINEFLETEGVRGNDGRTTSRFSLDPNMFYHPNKIGHEQIAELIEEKVGVPGNAEPVAPANAGLDLVFAVNAADSMAEREWSEVRISAGRGVLVLLPLRAGLVRGSFPRRFRW